MSPSDRPPQVPAPPVEALYWLRQGNALIFRPPRVPAPPEEAAFLRLQLHSLAKREPFPPSVLEAGRPHVAGEELCSLKSGVVGQLRTHPSRARFGGCEKIGTSTRAREIFVGFSLQLAGSQSHFFTAPLAWHFRVAGTVIVVTHGGNLVPARHNHPSVDLFWPYNHTPCPSHHGFIRISSSGLSRQPLDAPSWANHDKMVNLSNPGYSVSRRE